MKSTSELVSLAQKRVESVIADMREVDPAQRAAYAELLRVTLEHYVWRSSPELEVRLAANA